MLLRLEKRRVKAGDQRGATGRTLLVGRREGGRGGSDEARGGGSEGMQSDATRAYCPTEAWRRRTKT